MEKGLELTRLARLADDGKGQDGDDHDDAVRQIQSSPASFVDLLRSHVAKLVSPSIALSTVHLLNPRETSQWTTSRNEAICR